MNNPLVHCIEHDTHGTCEYTNMHFKTVMP
uniref:Uncharacterized protein n=1 Tax=Arundo donax TaxID=35708 RepID=A0A0A8Y4X5_ARUDO